MGMPQSWLGARHVSFLLTYHKVGLHWSPFAAKAAPITELPLCFVFGLLGWMGGPRQGD